MRFDPTGVELAKGVAVPASLLSFAFSRSGGPGGQHVNKTSTRATLTVYLADLAPYLPADAARRLPGLAGAYLAGDGDRLVIHSGDSRSQHANKAACVDKLRGVVQRAMRRPKVRRATKPSRASVERRLEGKRQRSRLKRDRGRPSD